MRTSVIALSLVATFTVPQRGHAQSADPAVTAVVRRLFDGMRAGDSAVVRSVFHPSARMVSVSERGGQRRTNIEASIDGFVKAVGTPRPEPLDERIWNERVFIDGALASVWVDYALYIGPRFSHCGVDHFLMVRDDAGAWKIIELADTRRTEGCTQRP
jgi:hypothetical protein